MVFVSGFIGGVSYFVLFDDGNVGSVVVNIYYVCIIKC